VPPLVAAACDGNAAAVREIVKSGADPNARYGALNWTPLMHAIHANQIGSVEALLDSGADVNRTGDDETEPRTKQRDVTPLMMAAGYGYRPIVELLLRRGADPARVDGDGNRALDYALSGTLYHRTFFQCQDSTVRALIAAHAPLDISSDTRRFASIKRCSALALLR
jgi:ankyrin repeat protein